MSTGTLKSMPIVTSPMKRTTYSGVMNAMFHSSSRNVLPVKITAPDCNSRNPQMFVSVHHLSVRYLLNNW